MDCGLCVKVCPTGIDIRNGTQLECINCTACMDACDEVMVKVNRDTGLIRYDSFNGIEQGRKRILTPRVMAYSFLLVLLIGVQIFFMSIRSDVQVLILRTPGILYQEVDEQTLSNLYNYQVINKTNKPMPIEFRLVTNYGQIKLVGDAPTVPKASMAEGALFIELPKNQLDDRKNRIKVAIYSEGKLLTEVKTSFLGPIK